MQVLLYIIPKKKWFRWLILGRNNVCVIKKTIILQYYNCIQPITTEFAMSAYEPPVGTFPLVFESGVINIDENGVLHIHLSHTAENPHPMVTHPEGEETTIPANVSKVELIGEESEDTKIRCGLMETDNLPTGCVFRFKGWRLLQLEMSGDLTIVMADMKNVPVWLQHGKIHRFDGPEEGVRLFRGSRPLVASGETKPRSIAQKTPFVPPKPKVQEEKKIMEEPKNDSTEPSRSGCALLVFVMIALGVGLSTIPFYV